MTIKNAFIFDSLIEEADLYKSMAKKYKNLNLQMKIFKSIRAQSVDEELDYNIKLYKKLIDNILLTDISLNTSEKIDIAKKYFIRDFYETPVYYGMHLLNFYKSNFIKENVKIVNMDIYLNTIKKYGTVVLNPLHNDLYQMLINYISSIKNKAVCSIYGIEYSLKKMEKINLIYTPTVRNVEFNYLNNSKGMPYPIMLRKAVRDIKNNKIVAIPPEISMGLGSQHSVQLLGKSVSMPLGSAWVSNKTNVPIIIVHTELLKNYKIQIKFEDPIFPMDIGSKKGIISQCEQVFNKIDQIIRDNPYSWCGYDTFDRMITNAK